MTESGCFLPWFTLVTAAVATIFLYIFKGLLAMPLGLYFCVQRLLSRVPNNLTLRPACQGILQNEIKPVFWQWPSSYQSLANNAQVTFHWQEPCTVGNTVSFTIKFFQCGGRPYPISDADQIQVDVRHGVNKVAAALQIGSSDEAHSMTASFTVRKAGQHYIYLHIDHKSIRSSPFIKNFTPGPPDPAKTTVVHPVSMDVCTIGVVHQIFLEPRDEFGNTCAWAHDVSQQQSALGAFSFQAFLVGSMEVVEPIVQWLWDEVSHRLLLKVIFQQQGIYLVRVLHKNVLLNKAEFNMIVLSRSESEDVEKKRNTHQVVYEAKLVSINNGKNGKRREVICALSPKQLAIKGYMLGFIPKRLATFRLRPSTKFTFHDGYQGCQNRTLSIEDGSHLKIELVIKDGHLLAAMFTHYLLRNIGGSETFGDKQEFFYQEMRKYHRKKAQGQLQLRVDREKLLQSSMKAVKYFSVSDWFKKFEVTFNGELGLDWGGVRREWIQVLCDVLFDRKRSGLFNSFYDDGQALVHPSSPIPAPYKLKHYKFAGRLVGKCLYDSSLGAGYRQLVKGRFTRSFLAQLIGLRVNYKYFAYDDPQLYLSKVKYIENNDVTDMELTFSEEEYDSNGQLLKTVELVPGGSRLVVTNDNKLRYLDALAQHRLVNNVKDQVEAFIRGLNQLVPDDLLSIFDENELELLMCGTSEYTVAELKSNHVVVGSTPEFQRVLSWFWTAVSNFGAEELSRLLQFTTGSSQLPVGGLGQLSPNIQISAAPTFGNLPTAHTCFNQLCLPDHKSYQQFEKALLLAINEGSEGFGFV